MNSSLHRPRTTHEDEWAERGAAVAVREVPEVRPSDGRTQSVTRVLKKGVKDFQFGRILGEGSYSTVIEARDRQTLRDYAIKVLDKRHILKEKKVKYVNIEKDTFNRLGDYPGVVRLYFTFQDEHSLYFVLDLATNGELLSFIKQLKSFDEPCANFYAAQILETLEYMHKMGVIHRDLKPENILLDSEMRVKITDFGTAKLLDLPHPHQKVRNGKTDTKPSESLELPTPESRANSFVGTAEYVSPELLANQTTSPASDIWALGCILYQMLAGRPPFKANNEYQTFQKILKLDYEIPVHFSLAAKDLISKLLVIDPANRLTIPEIKAHPFFQDQLWGSALWKSQVPRLRPMRNK